MGGDLVRFIDGVIGRPTFVAGLSSGGVLNAWLSAYAKPGQVLGAYYEDAPLFASEVRPSIGQGIGQSIGPLFSHMSKYLGDQWSIGDWDALVASVPVELPGWLGFVAARIRSRRRTTTEPQGIRPRVGPRVLDRDRGGELRPRANACVGEGAGALHSLHGEDPQLYTETLVGWATSLPTR